MISFNIEVVHWHIYESRVVNMDGNSCYAGCGSIYLTSAVRNVHSRKCGLPSSTCDWLSHTYFVRSCDSFSSISSWGFRVMLIGFDYMHKLWTMMTSKRGNAFTITGPLWVNPVKMGPTYKSESKCLLAQQRRTCPTKSQRYGAFLTGTNLVYKYVLV